jgi:hypothetical protein
LNASVFAHPNSTEGRFEEPGWGVPGVIRLISGMNVKGLSGAFNFCCSILAETQFCPTTAKRIPDLLATISTNEKPEPLPCESESPLAMPTAKAPLLTEHR